MTNEGFEKFESKAKLSFSDKKLLKQAFTHRSYINENKGLGLEHNERLEFLGDAVLELVVTDFLYHTYPNLDEGELTSIRSVLVNADTCAEVAEEMGANDFLLLSKGESKDMGRARQYILANTLEAVIGAIYIDRGYDGAKKFILENITSRAKGVVDSGAWIDSKSLFQEKAQEHESTTPTYKTLKETGPDHDKHFTVGVFIGKDLAGEGEGKSKQDAEQEAARNALKSKGWEN